MGEGYQRLPARKYAIGPTKFTAMAGAHSGLGPRTCSADLRDRSTQAVVARHTWTEAATSTAVL